MALRERQARHRFAGKQFAVGADPADLRIDLDMRHRVIQNHRRFAYPFTNIVHCDRKAFKTAYFTNVAVDQDLPDERA